MTPGINLQTLQEYYMAAEPGRPTILVVEDDPSVRSFLVEALQSEGYGVLIATNGQEGLERALVQPVALILLDLMMPVMNGWQFLELAQQEPRLTALPVVLLSASREVAAVALQNPAQIRAYLPKPFDLDQLLEYVQTYALPHSA